MSIFLDANILFSGSNPASNLHRFLHWLDGKEKLVTSAYAAEEAERNIRVKRPQWLEPFAALMRMVQIVPDKPLSVESSLPDKDKPILGAAIAARCAYLLTGDKRDFGHLYGKQIEGVTVLDVLTLAELMLEKHKS